MRVTKSSKRQPDPPRRGALVQALAATLWLPQAGLIALAVSRLAGGQSEPWRDIAPLALGVLALGLLRAWLDGFGGRMVFRAARARLTALRAEAATALATRSPLDTARPASGLASSVIAEQAEALMPYWLRYTPAQFRTALLPPLILLAVLPVSWLSALILFIAGPLIPVFMALIGMKAKEASEARMVELGGMNAFLLDRLRGLETIRAFEATDRLATGLRAQAENLRERTMAVLRIAFLSSAVLELFAALGVALVAVQIGFTLLGPIEIGHWGSPMTLGEGLFVLLLAPAFFEPLRDLAAAWHDRAAGQAGLQALRNLAEPGLPLPGALDEPAPAPATTPALTIEHLRFTHAGAEAPVFEDFSLRLQPGERVALLGPSGSGKSTLLGLVAGLAPAEGVIALDGVALGEETAAAHRARLAWIGQQPHFFAGSLRANVSLGRPGIGAAATAEALAHAALPELALRQQEAMGEAGAGLSGGQALRLAIARALAHPEARLILADEPTAHLDRASAEAVTSALLTLAEGRGLLVATHDPALAARMDRVIHLGTPEAARQPELVA